MDPMSETPAIVEFGRFRILPHRREFLVDGQPIRIGGLPTHGLGPRWFRYAFPSSWWTRTTYSLPVSCRTQIKSKCYYILILGSAGFCRETARLSTAPASRPGSTGQGRIVPRARGLDQFREPEWATSAKLPLCGLACAITARASPS
jgi:hypothetical protein